MVQVDISHFSTECNVWRNALRLHREAFTRDKNKLQAFASHTIPKELLLDVEHFHNQFHIQLINIHDLKQRIKFQERLIKKEGAENNGLLREETIGEQEFLFHQFHFMENTLLELRAEFLLFLEKASG